MSKSTNKRIEPQGSLTERSKAKSTDKQTRAMTFTREIVIQTQEPDIPQITILKVQRVEQGEFSVGFQQVIKLFQRVRLKRMFKGFSQMCSIYQASKIKLANCVKFASIMKIRQKGLLKLAWTKFSKSNSQFLTKLNASRLFSKLSLLYLNKAKYQAFNKIKQCIFSRTKRSMTELGEPTTKKVEQNLELQITKLRSQQFSQKFMTLCKKFIKYNNRKFIQAVILELQPNIQKEIQRYQQFRKNQGIAANNETVLVVLNNHIIAIKDLKKDLDANQLILNNFQKEDVSNKLIFYQEAEQQFEKADNQIRASFEKQNKIDEKQLSKILESQLLKWNRLKEYSIYSSRLFITALVARSAKDGASRFNDYLNTLQNFLRLCTDVKKIEQFKKNFGNQQRSTTILIQLANKFIDLNTFGMTSIVQKGFSENQQAFMSEIKYIRQQMQDFISKFNNPAQKKKLKKTFSTKKAKAPEELRDLYSTINQLIGLIQKSQAVAKGPEAGLDFVKQKIIKIVQTFISCLKEGNYQKWETFVNKQVNKEQFKEVLKLLDEINDILNEKITEETQITSQQVKKLKLSESKLRQECNNLKSKNSDLEKKIKASQASKAKQSKQGEAQQYIKKLNEWQSKYNEILDKYTRLQKSQEKSSSVSKAQNDKEINLLRKKIEQKDEEIRKLKERLPTSKDKFDIKDYNQTKKINENLNRKVAELTQKLQFSIEQIQSRQSEIQNIKNTVILEQNNQIVIQNLKNENEAISRKINIMSNKIQSLDQELDEKKKRVEQLQRERLDQQSKRPMRPSFKNEKNIENSMDLIKQLNSQLQKLKKSEVSLEQINKELENVHNRGQDVQVLISKIQLENNELKKAQLEKDKLIWELKMEINRFNNQLSLLNSHIYSLENELNDREQNIKRMENLMKDSEQMANRELQNKKDYIQKLEGIINSNERSMNDLNLEIQRLRTESENKSNVRNQFEIQKRLNQLKEALSKIASLELELSNYDRKYQFERKSWIENQAKWQRVEQQLNYKIADISNRHELQKRSWQDQMSKFTNFNQILNDNENRYQNQKRRWEEDRQKWSSQKLQLQRQLQGWVLETQKWEADKAKYNAQREKLEIQWKNFIFRYEQATGQNSRLLAQLTQLNSTIDHLRYQISLMGSSSINADNIVWLLANITSSYLRIQPKPTPAENEKTSQQIFIDLSSIKEQFINAQEDMFLNMENYIVRFIEADIGRYRYELAVKIDELSALKQRLIEFLNNQIQISKRSLTYQYNYELKESSTAAKSAYDTPAKTYEKGFKISQEIKEIKQKTLHARQLF